MKGHANHARWVALWALLGVAGCSASRPASDTTPPPRVEAATPAAFDWRPPLQRDSDAFAERYVQTIASALPTVRRAELPNPLSEARLFVFETGDGSPRRCGALGGPILFLACMDAESTWSVVSQHAELAPRWTRDHADGYRVTAVLDANADGLPEVVVREGEREPPREVVVEARGDGSFHRTSEHRCKTGPLTHGWL